MMKQMNDEEGGAPGLTTQHTARPRDTLSQRGAMELARRLEKYWHDRGYIAARFWAELIDERFAKVGTYEIYCVKCNLVRGLPPRYYHQ
jgi:hypothetical protein